MKQREEYRRNNSCCLSKGRDKPSRVTGRKSKGKSAGSANKNSAQTGEGTRGNYGRSCTSSWSFNICAVKGNEIVQFNLINNVPLSFPINRTDFSATRDSLHFCCHVLRYSCFSLNDLLYPVQVDCSEQTCFFEELSSGCLHVLCFAINVSIDFHEDTPASNLCDLYRTVSDLAGYACVDTAKELFHVAAEKPYASMAHEQEDRRRVDCIG